MCDVYLYNGFAVNMGGRVRVMWILFCNDTFVCLGTVK